ncbi:hypothetical protein CAP2UW1_4002 [Candidatus Accumulibacter phosphatis]|uniref:Uncharacterized protein n=1 Tax=Accumulibacter regalis TaxID=522306 RepID=C7RN61_ACCRE
MLGSCEIGQPQCVQEKARTRPAVVPASRKGSVPVSPVSDGQRLGKHVSGARLPGKNE